MVAELVPYRPPVVRFGGGPLRFEADMVGAPRPAVAYRVPANTLDPRHAACTQHRVACDCREAEHAEEVGELRAEAREVQSAARRALSGHQLQQPIQPGLWEPSTRIQVPLCLCSGCVIARETGVLLAFSDVDWETGRIR